MEDFRKKSQRYFSQTAQRYVDSVDHRFQEDLAHLLAWADLQPSHLALDIATGGGHTARALAPHCRRVIAADLTGPMLVAARDAMPQEVADPLRYVQAEASRLPFPDRVFDRIACRIAPHHFPDPNGFLAEAARLLAPNGRFLMIDSVAPEDIPLGRFLNDMERRRDPSHLESLTVSTWKARLADAGLALQREKLFRKRHPFAEWTARAMMDEASALALERWMLGQPEETQRHFAFEVENGRLIAYTDEKWLVWVERSRAL